VTTAMMPEIAMNVLDIAQNSVKACSAISDSSYSPLIEINTEINTVTDFLTIYVKDNGTGMSPEQLERVTDPFFTTRTTRKVGLGVSFFKMAAEMSGGNFEITSTLGVGTKVTAVFGLSNMDRMPLGDMSETIRSLIVYNTHLEFLYTYKVVYPDGTEEFELSTTEMKDLLEGVPLDNPEVSLYIRDFLKENTDTANRGNIF
jgi:hypothetical protein